MRKLTKRILRYFVKPDNIIVDDVTATEYSVSDNQFTDEELGVGEDARQLTNELIEEGMEDIVSAFYRSVHKVYCVFVDTLRKKFPFQFSLLADLMVLNPSERSRQDLRMLSLVW